MLSHFLKAAAILTASVFAIGANAQQWQTHTNESLSIKLTKTYSNGRTETVSYNPKLAWIAEGSKDFKEADVVVHCGRDNKPLLYFSTSGPDEGTPAPMFATKVLIGSQEFEAEAKYKGRRGFRYEMPLSKSLISAMKRGNRFQIMVDEVVLWDFSLKGSSRAISNALRHC